MNPFVIYNWKTYIDSPDDAVALAGALDGSDKVTIVICPSALHFSVVAGVVVDKKISFGAQDISESADHPQTGSLSGEQIVQSGASYVIVGHAETRAAGVTNSVVAGKMVHAFSAGLIPIVCLSEQEKIDSEEHPGEEVVAQLKDILTTTKNVVPNTEEGAPSFVVAYEPTAYIGADSALAPDKIKDITSLLRDVLENFTMPNIPVIYGGSVAVENVEGIFQHSGTDGFLVGRAGCDSKTANTITSSL